MKFYIYPIGGNVTDTIATQPDPVDQDKVGQHIERWLERYRHQGYYSNERQERIPLSEIQFRLEQAEPEEPVVRRTTSGARRILFGQRSPEDEEQRWTDGTDLSMEPA